MLNTGLSIYTPMQQQMRLLVWSLHSRVNIYTRLIPVSPFTLRYWIKIKDISNYVAEDTAKERSQLGWNVFRIMLNYQWQIFIWHNGHIICRESSNILIHHFPWLVENRIAHMYPNMEANGRQCRISMNANDFASNL